MAYKSSSNKKLLELELTLFKKAAKRKASDEPEPVENLVRNVGRWTFSEKQRFRTGVAEHGWGNWLRVASIVGTRNRKQVEEFSTTSEGKRNKIMPSTFSSIVPALTDLAAGIKVVSRSLEAHTTRTKEADIEEHQDVEE